ncbi:MAG: serine/threonine-protein phosphatase [Pseudomonadales bacterium]|nr:serine/threonine-protein phosphatase [Pseudomonadales bacterium]
MMPETPFSVGNVTFAHKIIPSLILSGDFIDYFELPDRRLLFFIADVSGHGASSAFVTVLLKSLSRRLEHEFEDLNLQGTSDILAWINRELLQCDLEQHVTMFLGVVDKSKKKLEYSNAAHFPGVILSSAEATVFLEIGGLPLGLYRSAEYESRHVNLPEAFTLVMFSDGVFEIMPQETLKAKEENLLSLVKYGNRSIENLTDHLGLDAVQDVPDDIAIFTVAKAG